MAVIVLCHAATFLPRDTQVALLSSCPSTDHEACDTFGVWQGYVPKSGTFGSQSACILHVAKPAQLSFPLNEALRPSRVCGTGASLTLLSAPPPPPPWVLPVTAEVRDLVNCSRPGVFLSL